MLVRDFPVQERPVNRVCEMGAQSVSGVELLASLLQTGDAFAHARALLERFGDLYGLAQASIAEIIQVKGLGKAQAARIKAALELGRRVLTETPEEKYQIRSPADAAHLLLGTLGPATQEHFVILYLDTRNRVIEQETLYKGTLNTSVVRIAEVFQGAIARRCAGIVVAHNHPSGDPTPSPEDVALTRRLVDAGKLVEIDVLDHLVIGRNRYVSLRERALGFEGV
ncbi:MAG TPA: DNA repair protein RadC [Anaerolineae bacterium]|nr:DNA repair protein RadC [Anaerolineae bacterium]